MDINFFQHQESLYELIAQSDSLQSTHIAVYQALFRYWNHQFFKNPIEMSRDEVMCLAGIKSRTTFYKTLQVLEQQHLIRYYPSKSIYEKSYLCMSALYKMQDAVQIKVVELLDNSLPNIPDLPAEKARIEKFGLFNGRYRLALMKEIVVPVQRVLFNTHIRKLDDKPANQAPKNSHVNTHRSPNKYQKYAKHPSSINGSNLRPPGVPIDPDADYSIPL